MVMEIIMPILQTGAVGGMLVWSWKHMAKKDKKSYEMIEAQNVERREMYESMTELVKETTIALAHKNLTDDKMSSAVEKLTEQLRELKEVVKTMSTQPPSNPTNLPWHRRDES